MVILPRGHFICLYQKEILRVAGPVLIKHKLTHPYLILYKIHQIPLHQCLHLSSIHECYTVYSPKTKNCGLSQILYRDTLCYLTCVELMLKRKGERYKSGNGRGVRKEIIMEFYR